MKFWYSYLAVFLIVVFQPYSSSVMGKQMIITSDMQYEYALELFEAEDYDTAIVEFKRFVHFFPESEYLDQVEYNIAICLFNKKKYHEAARVFNEIIIKSRDNKIIEQAVFFQSRSFMKLGNRGYAQIVLQNYLKLVDDINTKDKIYFNLAQIHLSNARKLQPGSLALAKKYLSKISPSNANKYRIDEYSDLIFKAEHAPRKNPKAAGLFAIIPGGGFLYCERYHDALITFLLNTGLMYAAWEAWDSDNKALAGVIGFVETGFYSGNIYGSITSAHKYNRAQTMKILGRDVLITPDFDPKDKAYGLSFNFKF
ncbi:MAG: outer membrane protein assembly factor BamD [Thermodesulfobacteriota bacterium]